MPLGLIAAFAAASALLPGCQKKEREPQTLKVLINMPADGPVGYKTAYGGELFESKFPDVELTYINSGDRVPLDRNIVGSYVDLVKEEKPDVIVTPYYATLASQGLLLDLSPYIRKDRYSLDDYYAPVLNWLRAPASTQELYGLAPQFQSTALYYNRSLFDRYGVQPPADGMTWADLLRLAQRFPVQDDAGARLYGFHLGAFSTPYYYAAAMLPGLRTDDGNGRLTMNTDGWKTELAPLLAALGSGSLSYRAGMDDGNDADFEDGRAFAEGRAAMMLAGPDWIDRLADAPFEWGIAARPIDPKAPYGDLVPMPVYAIYRNAEHADLAWKYIAYMNGEETAKTRSRSGPILSARKGIAETRAGVSLEPFYGREVRPPVAEDAAPYKLPPLFFSQRIVPLIDRELDRVVQGKAALDDALRTIQAEGQAQLDQELSSGTDQP